MRVSAVIPQWNRRELLVGLLQDLKRQSHPLDEILVVDNGSTDGSADAAVNEGARVIRLPQNRGFAHAVNRGIRDSSADWIAVLNNDVHLPPEWLSRLLEASQQTDCWFAAGKLLSARNPSLVDGCFDLLSRGACAWRAGHGRPDSPVWNEPRRISFAPFTAAIFRRELFERSGMLDETFESYLEDVEFGIRCALAGCSGIYVPSAVARHEGSATLGTWNRDTVRRISRNQLLIVAKHYPPDWLGRYGWPVVVGQLLWGVLALRHGAGWSFVRGKREAIKTLRRTPRQKNIGLDALLRNSELQIRELQQKTGYDRFWRIYFGLT
jgi:GT2 family glycosyltransferase